MVRVEKMIDFVYAKLVKPHFLLSAYWEKKNSDLYG